MNINVERMLQLATEYNRLAYESQYDSRYSTRLYNWYDALGPSDRTRVRQAVASSAATNSRELNIDIDMLLHMEFKI